MSKRNIRYYFNPAYEGYLRELKNLAKHGGGISRELALLADIRSGVDLNPEQVEVFNDPQYYGGRLELLEESVRKKRKAMIQAWLLFLKASDAPSA